MILLLSNFFIGAGVLGGLAALVYFLVESYYVYGPLAPVALIVGFIACVVTGKLFTRWVDHAG